MDIFLEIQACRVLQCTKNSKKICCFLISVQSSVSNKWIRNIFWLQMMSGFFPPPWLNNLAKPRCCCIFNCFCYVTLKCQFGLILWDQSTFSCLMPDVWMFCDAHAPTMSTWNTLRGWQDIDFNSYILLYDVPKFEVGQKERRGRNKRK